MAGRQWINLAGGHERAMLDVVRLMETRLLVQANSGGGKSWCLRRLLEQTAPYVQWIVIDPEGEFRSLREKIDCVIAAPKDGDVEAHPASAALLARRLLETQLPAVVDIYELKAHERHQFVQRFCEALVDAPKSLWHPVLVVLDEAHVYAPQQGESVARGAVMDLATRGRKRGFALCAATQRLSKLHKDVAAELLNKLIGRTGLDVDVKRATDELGFDDKEQKRSLRSLDPGKFFMFGPALEAESVMAASIGPVRTTHPKAGHRLMAAPPKPSKKILRVLGKELADLPKQAQQERNELEHLREQVRQLRSEATRAKYVSKAPPVPKVDVSKLELAASVKVAKDFEARLQPYQRQLLKFIEDFTARGKKLVTFWPRQRSPYKVDFKHLRELSAKMQAAPVKSTMVRLDGFDVKVDPRPITRAERAQTRGELRDAMDGYQLRSGAIKIVKELVARAPAGYSRSQVATLVCMSPKGGTYLTYLSDLRRTGNIEERDGLVYASEVAIATFGGDVQAPKTHDEVMAMWGKALRKGAFEMLKYVVINNGVSREDLAAAMNMAPKGGTYLTYLSDLRRNGLVIEKDGGIQMTSILFPEDA